MLTATPNKSRVGLWGCFRSLAGIVRDILSSQRMMTMASKRTKKMPWWVEACSSEPMTMVEVSKTSAQSSLTWTAWCSSAFNTPIIMMMKIMRTRMVSLPIPKMHLRALSIAGRSCQRGQTCTPNAWAVQLQATNAISRIAGTVPRLMMTKMAMSLRPTGMVRCAKTMLMTRMMSSIAVEIPFRSKNWTAGWLLLTIRLPLHRLWCQRRQQYLWMIHQAQASRQKLTILNKSLETWAWHIRILKA